MRVLGNKIANGATAVALVLAITGCSGLTTTRTQGYALSESAMQQIRPGQSEALVVAVLGTPQSKNTLSTETAYYYIQTRIEETAFGMQNVKDRKVLAIYFDKNMKVTDKALYGIEDGRVIAIESRRTPSFGEDKTFIESLVSSVTGI